MCYPLLIVTLIQCANLIIKAISDYPLYRSVDKVCGMQIFDQVTLYIQTRFKYTEQNKAKISDGQNELNTQIREESLCVVFPSQPSELYGFHNSSATQTMELMSTKAA